MDDEDRPKQPAATAIGEVLDALSVRELEARILALEAEIERVRAELARKMAHAEAVSSVFKS